MFRSLSLKIKRTGDEYILARYISALGLIDLPVPEKILLMLVEMHTKIPDQAVLDADKLISDLQFDEGGGPYLKSDDIVEDDINGLIPVSKLAAIKVCRAIGISSATNIREFSDVVWSCLTPSAPGAKLDESAVNYARIILHRLSKGRGVGLAEIDGMPIAVHIVENVVPEQFVAELMKYAELKELCKWTGTFASIFRAEEGRRKRSMVQRELVIKMAQRCLDLIEGLAEGQSPTPRAFSSICKAIKNITPYKTSKELSERLLRSVDFRRTLVNDFTSNLAIDPSYDNMSRRISTTVSLFVTLLRRVGRNADAFALLENWKSLLPENDFDIKLESQCRLQRLSVANKLRLPQVNVDDEFASIMEDLKERQGSPVVKITELLRIVNHRQGHAGGEELDLIDEFDTLFALTCAGLDEIPSPLLCQVVELFVLQHFKEAAPDDRMLINELLDFCETSDDRTVLFDNYVSILTVLAGLAKYPYAGRSTKDRAKHALRLSVDLLKVSQHYAGAAKTSLIDAGDIRNLFWGTGELMRGDRRLVAEFAAAIEETMKQLSYGEPA